MIKNLAQEIMQMTQIPKNNFKRAFTLTEVLIATIVMSMIMGSVLAFVQYSGNIWQRGNEKISSQNYSRMAFELIKQDLLQADKVTTPKVNKTSKRLIYYKDDIKYKIAIATGTIATDTLVRTSDDATVSASAMMRLARNIHLFQVNRISSRTFEISLQIKKDLTKNYFYTIISNSGSLFATICH